MKKYKIFQFTDHNSGYYFWEGDSIMKARDIAKKFSKAQVENDRGAFELYEDGKKTEWSLIPIK